MSNQPTVDELQAKIKELESKIRYGLVWEDKPEDIEQECETKIPILKEVPELCVPPVDPTNPGLFDEDKAPVDHLLVEGDNYHALRVMQYTHAGQIDVIYIDPPYNTGNKDFVYNDNYVDKEDTFRHSKWLSFMSKRLELARNLLSDRGVIFISIDDNEQAQLKLLCDQIFGEENFVANFVWRRRTSSAMTQNMSSVDHEYVLAYQKSSNFSFIGVEKDYDAYENPDNDPRGPWVLGDLTVGMDKTMRPNQFYDLVDPATGNVYKPNPNRVWSYIPESMKVKISEGRVVFPSDTSKKPMLKRYQTDLKSNYNPISTWIENAKSKGEGLKSGLNTEATKEIQEILGSNEFNYAKPKSLIISLLRATADSSSIVLDFMAGSGTTGQAVMELNAEDGGNRQCILVTNNESNGVGQKLIEDNPDKDPEEFGICRRVTRERLKRVIEGYTNSKGQQVEGLSGNKLRYFRSDFVEPIEEMEDETMLILAENAFEILKIKENCFDLVEKNRHYAIYIGEREKVKSKSEEGIGNKEEGKGKREGDVVPDSRVLAIYFSEDRSKLEEFKQKVESLNLPTTAYIFAYMLGKFQDFFENNPQIEIKDFPEPVMRALVGNRL